MQESLGRQGISVSLLCVCLCEPHTLPMRKRNASTIQTAICQTEHLRGSVCACLCVCLCVCTCVSGCSCPQQRECVVVVVVSNMFPGGAIRAAQVVLVINF